MKNEKTELPIVKARKVKIGTSYHFYQTEFYDENGTIILIIPPEERQPQKMKTIEINGKMYQVRWD